MAQERQYKIIIRLDGKDNASDELRKVNRGLDKVRASGKSAEFGIGGLNSALGDFGIGLSAMGIARSVLELNSLGIEVKAVKTTFEQMSGGATAASASLEDMRKITGRVIDDMTLMQGANSMLVTGLAQTNEQAAELVNLGARLGQAMGKDATESITNLSMALLNNSFVRLDTLGISAAEARDRVNELKEAGLNMSEAFSQAVLELGTKTLDKLGVAAATSETAVNRLATRWQNLTLRVGEFVAVGVEAGATLIELGILTSEEGLNAVVSAGLGRELSGPEAAIVSFLEAAPTALSPFGGVLLSTLDDGAEATGQMADDFETMAEMSGVITYDFVPPSLEQLGALGNMTQLETTFQNLSRLPGAIFTQDISGIAILDPANYRAIESELASIETQFETLTFLAEQGLITEDELANMEGYVGAAQRMAEAAGDAADNFERMSLSQLFNVTGGGRLGELSDLVLADIEDTELRAEIQLAFDLRTGRTTELEQAFETEFSDVLAAIATELGPDVAASAMERALTTLEQGQLTGLDDQTIIDMVRQALGFQFLSDTAQLGGVGMTMGGGIPEGAGFGSGPTIEAIAGGGALQPLEDSFDSVREATTTISENLLSAAETDFTGTLSPFQSDLDIADSTVQAIRTELDSLANSEYRAHFFLDMAVADETGLQLARAP